MGHPGGVIDERLETLALNAAWVVAAAFTAFVLGMWQRTGEVEAPALVGVVLVWGVLAFGAVSRPRRRGAA